jgi:hypothetical protein
LQLSILQESAVMGPVSLQIDFAIHEGFEV